MANHMCIGKYTLLSVCSKKLFSTVHNFVHLNLALSLFVAYMIFAVCIELATSSEVSTITFVLYIYLMFATCYTLAA